MEGNLEIIWYNPSILPRKLEERTGPGHVTCLGQNSLEEKQLTLEWDYVLQFPSMMANPPS